MHRSNSRVSHAQVRALAGWRSGVCRSPHPQLGSAPFLPSSPAAPTARHACSYLVDLVGDPLECLALLHEIEHLLALGGRLHAGHALAAAARTGEARRRRHTRHTSRGVARGAGKGPSAHAQAAGEVAGAECRHGGGRAAAAWRGVVAQQPASQGGENARAPHQRSRRGSGLPASLCPCADAPPSSAAPHLLEIGVLSHGTEPGATGAALGAAGTGGGAGAAATGWGSGWGAGAGSGSGSGSDTGAGAGAATGSGAGAGAGAGAAWSLPPLSAAVKALTTSSCSPALRLLAASSAPREAAAEAPSDDMPAADRARARALARPGECPGQGGRGRAATEKGRKMRFFERGAGAGARRPPSGRSEGDTGEAARQRAAWPIGGHSAAGCRGAGCAPRQTPDGPAGNVPFRSHSRSPLSEPTDSHTFRGFEPCVRARAPPPTHPPTHPPHWRPLPCGSACARTHPVAGGWRAAASGLVPPTTATHPKQLPVHYATTVRAGGDTRWSARTPARPPPPSPYARLPARCWSGCPLHLPRPQRPSARCPAACGGARW